jgi:hypothetical protein
VIPGSWTTVNGETFGGFSSLTPCDTPLDEDGLIHEQEITFEGTGPDGTPGRILTAVAEFETDAQAGAYLDQLPDSISCGFWTDIEGIEHDISQEDISDPSGDQSLLFEDILTSSAGTFDADYAFYKVGRFVGFVTNLAAESNSVEFTEELLGIGAGTLGEIANV